MTTVIKHLMHTRRLESPLKFLQTHQDGKDPKNKLPSWVPDYSKEDTEGHLMIPNVWGCTPYKAGADNAAWSPLSEPRLAPQLFSERYSKTLGRLMSILLGWLCWILMRRLDSADLEYEDEGSEEASPMPFTEYYNGTNAEEERNNKRKRREDTITTCKAWEQQAQRLCPESNPYSTTCGLKAAFWRTLITDRDLYSKGPPKPSRDFSGRFEAWMGRRKDEADDREYMRPFSDAAVWRCIKRSFVITEKGYLGLAPWRAERGDAICVLRSGDVPFVLRGRKDGYWELVGESYVHGFMQGSFGRRASKTDALELKIR